VSQEGDTLLIRGSEVLGHRFDVTFEAVAFGAIAGLRIATIVAAFALFSACVDPDELLRSFRRLGFRSALTATLATRLVPVLARDATRMGEAGKCRAEPAGRAAVARAALGGALERAVDVAAALEVRGYALARPAAARRREHLSRHDVSVAFAAFAVLAVAVVGRVLGAGSVEAYPRFSMDAGAAEGVLCALTVLATTLPFGVPGARAGVARA
jgi:energy-coupling factor transport system permease protein